MQPVSYIGARVKNGLRFFFRRAQGYCSEYGQDRWVAEEMFRGMRGGYFVDVGAYDGYIASNTYALEKRFGWSGLCIEPNTRIFRRLRAWRSSECIEACVAANEGTVEFLEAAGVWGGIVGQFPSNWSTVLRRYLLERTIFKDGAYNTVTKKAVSLVSLLREYNAPRVIHYLSIDTEGSEFDILRTFPFSEYTFLTITAEHNSVPGARDQMRQLLLANGYRIAREGRVDDFYVHESFKRA